MACGSAKLTPLASVNEDMELDWHDENVASADVNTALEEFINNME